MRAPVASGEIEVRDAACAILIDDSSTEPALLLGQRRSDQVFLPNKWVFPGGRVDESDRALAASFLGIYAPNDLATGVRPFVFAALRELHEETGLLIGMESTAHAPAAHQLLPLARAITPPGRIRRYDTWFFAASRAAVVSTAHEPDGELLNLGWFTLDEARRLDLPTITRLMLEELAVKFGETSGKCPNASEKVPFYTPSACGFERTLISCIDPSRP